MNMTRADMYWYYDATMVAVLLHDCVLTLMTPLPILLFLPTLMKLTSALSLVGLSPVSVLGAVSMSAGTLVIAASYQSQHQCRPCTVMSYRVITCFTGISSHVSSHDYS